MKNSEFRQPLEIALDRALSYLDSLDQMPVTSQVDRAKVRSRLAKPLTDAGVSPELWLRNWLETVERTVQAFSDVLKQPRAHDCSSCAAAEVDATLERS
jgi:hypothetical protein